MININTKPITYISYWGPGYYRQALDEYKYLKLCAYVCYIGTISILTTQVVVYL